MERKDRDQRQQTHGGNQGISGNEDKFGNKSFAGATSTDFDKQRMQTVEANEPDDNNLREGDTNADETRGVSNTSKSPSQMDNRTGEDAAGDLIDSGSIRTAAFDEGNEPGNKDYPDHRGATQGSNDRPMGTDEQPSRH